MEGNQALPSSPAHGGVVKRVLRSLFGFRWPIRASGDAIPEGPWLTKYKAILAAILPPDYLGTDGLLEPAAGDSPEDRRKEYVEIIPPTHVPERRTMRERVFGSQVHDDRDAIHASPDDLPVIDISSL